MNIQAGTKVAVTDAQGCNRGFKVWVICPHCEEGRWLREQSIKHKKFTGLCSKCHAIYTSGRMERHSNWKGGKTKRDGYVYVRLSPDDPYYSMANKSGYIREHRLVMARHLGRLLKPNEVVHHKNEIRDDNRCENLELIKGAVYHLLDSNPNSKITRLKKRIDELKEANGNKAPAKNVNK